MPKRRFLNAAVLLWLAAAACTRQTRSSPPVEVKVVVVAMFERGEDSGDVPGEYQYWVEREQLDQVLPLGAGYHPLRANGDGVLGLLTGVGTARAAAAVMALGLDPRFDLRKAYWIVAGIGGGDPRDVSLGSAVWVDRVLDGDLAYEIDAREIPAEWTTGYVPLGKSAPYEQPVNEQRAGIFALNPGLAAWAFALTRDTPLADSAELRSFRGRFPGFPNALRPPFVARGDEVSSSTFWHGSKLDQWANDWVRYYTAGRGNYVVCAMEDSGTLASLRLLGAAGRADPDRALVLRTVSNYDREPPGTSPAESLKSMASGNYSAYYPALEAAERVGDRVVRELVAHWRERRAEIPRAEPVD